MDCSIYIEVLHAHRPPKSSIVVGSVEDLILISHDCAANIKRYRDGNRKGLEAYRQLGPCGYHLSHLRGELPSLAEQEADLFYPSPEVAVLGRLLRGTPIEHIPLGPPERENNEMKIQKREKEAKGYRQRDHILIIFAMVFSSNPQPFFQAFSQSTLIQPSNLPTFSAPDQRVPAPLPCCQQRDDSGSFS